MNQILAIDPGLRSCGAAWNDTDGTVHTLTVRPASRSIRDRYREIVMALPERGWDLLVIELPQVYQGAKQKGDPGDLISLAVLVGGLLCTIGAHRAELIKPAAWKKQIPKAIHHARIREQLSGLGRASKDAMDAAGLWLYARDLQAARDHAKRTRRAL
jgi:hypothetical protein